MWLNKPMFHPPPSRRCAVDVTTVQHISFLIENGSMGTMNSFEEKSDEVLQDSCVDTSEQDHCLVSVIMPAYNSAEFIAESIESVLLQEYTAWELLIVDDGSTDDTANIVRQYVAHDSRIRLIQQENMGVSAARNAGMAIASGAYISFLDSDDLWSQDFLRLSVEMLISNAKLGAVSCEYVRFIDGTAKGKRDPWKNYIYFDNKYHDLLIHINVHINTLMIRKSALRADLLFNQSLSHAEDCDFLIRLSQLVKIAHIPNVMLYYRLRSTGLSGNYTKALEAEQLMLEAHWEDAGLPEKVKRLSKSSFAFKQAVVHGFAARKWGMALYYYAEAIRIAPTNWATYLLPIRKVYMALMPPLYFALPARAKQDIRISLVIPTINRREPLERLLRSLQNQLYTNFEVLIADQNSPEYLDDLLGSYSKTLHIQRVLVDSCGVSAARNTLLPLISGSIVAFPDDDCFYDPRTLENVAKIFNSEPACSVLLGNYLPPEDSKLPQSDVAMRSFTLKKENRYSVFHKAGTIVQFFRRGVVDAVGSFDEQLGPGSRTVYGCGEDTDYVIRAMHCGGTVFRSADVHVYHELVNLLDPNIASKAYAYGRGRGRILLKHKFGLGFKLLNCLLPLAKMCFEGPAVWRYSWGMFKGRFDELVAPWKNDTSE